MHQTVLIIIISRWDTLYIYKEYIEYIQLSFWLQILTSVLTILTAAILKPPVITSGGLSIVGVELGITP